MLNELQRGAHREEPGATILVGSRVRFHLLRCLAPLCSLLLVGCGLIGRREDPQPVASVEMGGPPIDAARLQGADWVLAPPDPRMAVDPSLPRWRHPSLEAVYSLPPAERPNLVPALSLSDAPLRANAAIGLARWGDGRGLQVLYETVENEQLKLQLRQASAEALGNIAQPSPIPALRKLLQSWGRYEPSRALHYSPELHGELLRALSRHVDAADDPVFVESLVAPTVGPRQEALAAWSRSKAVELPASVVDLRADPNPQIRAAAMTMLIMRRHPQAVEYARSALQDYETEVRIAAVGALGRSGMPEARELLERVQLHEGEVLRAEAVTALHQLGSFSAVQNGAGDKAWRVRRAAAQCLAQHADRVSIGLARTLLVDDSAEVRKATIASLENWPLESAGPVLLVAMAEPVYESRRLAGEQLARRWPPAQGFTPDIPADRRREAVAVLEGLWSAEFGTIDRAALAATAPPQAAVQGGVVKVGYEAPIPSAAASLPSEDRLQRLEQLIAEAARNEAAVGTFDAYGPDVVTGLEQLVLTRGTVLPEVIYKKMLPPKDSVFAALEQLTWPDVHERRKAATRLAEAAETTPLRPLAVARLVQLGLKENDGLVWSGLFAAVADDASDTAAELAIGGLSHPSPEVRRMACEHLGRTPRPRYSDSLIAALADQHVSVVIEAARALGHSGMLADPTPIERLLTSRDPTVRLTSAQTLHKNGLPSGAAALERLAHDKDPEVRRRTAAAIGESGDASLVPTLIGLMDDEAAGSKKAAIDALTKLIGRDVSLRPNEPLPALNDRAAAWKSWHSGKLMQ